jgi:hypothetical protein
VKKLLTILFFLPLFSQATNYTWSTSSTDVLINDVVFGNLNAGDTVFIPIKSGGYRSYSIVNADSGSDGGYIVVYWRPGAFITPSCNNFLDYITNSRGVKTVGLEKQNNCDQWRSGTTGYSSYIWFDSLNMRGSNGFGLLPTGSLPNYNGTMATAMHHWKWTNCVFDSLAGSNSGGVAISLGTFPINRYEFWFDCEISNCSFSNYSSLASPANYIAAFNCYNTLIDRCTFTTLGNPSVTNPAGHASVINAYAFHGTISNCFFGSYNFGNDIRIRSTDMPSAGAAYTGRTRVFNCITKNKRKYAFLEAQEPDTTGYGGGYVRRRTAPEVWHITCYNMAVGAGGNNPYQTAIVDDYLTDTVTVKNSILTMIRDTTWGTGLGPFIFAQSTGNITFKDTAGTRLVQLWPNSGIADSVNFYPSAPGILYNTGATPPAYITTDIYENPRTGGGAADIGAAEYTLPGRGDYRLKGKRFNRLQ